MSVPVRSRQRGFSLIEVLLATMLLAAGLALAFASLRAATATATRGEDIAQRNEHMRAVELFLRRRIGGARPVQFGLNQDTGMPRRFEGDATHMRFVADLPDYLGRGGPYLHELTLVDGDDGQRLEVAFTLVLAGETKAETPPRPPEVLAGPLREATFRYRAMKADNTLGDWQDQWTAGDRLPLQVEVTLRDADGRAWPPMVMALPLAAGYVGSAL
ncbi:prepilin-type N-terminal cleavage/methylation domain-containing protein [Lysobacter sp. 2RAF19]